jgi:CubicO group peptidase (beta-lactamase class C family)
MMIHGMRVAALVGVLSLPAASYAAHGDSGSSSAGRPAPPADVAAVSRKLDEYLQGELKNHHFSGTVLVARGGQVLLSKGYGFASLEWELPNTPQTKFRVGSLTKQFTATVIMQLRERRLLELTDSVCKYLQPCPEAWMPVTIHHLLSHTSGVPGYPNTKENPPPWTEARIAAIFRERSLEFRPGERAKYSDWGYYLLGLVIQKITGKGYEEVLQEQILAPLGMKDTGYDRSATILKQRAAGYRLNGSQRQNADYIDMNEPFSAGALYSTVEDLYQWDQALYSDTVLPQKALELMWTPVLTNYGYGWWVSEPVPSAASPPTWWGLPGRLQICHSGGINGFVSEFLRFPNEHVTVIVLANTEIETIIAPFLAAIVLGDKFSLPN